jgi:mannose-6-phosphate isomerase-like protein (cupin superfamily)
MGNRRVVTGKDASGKSVFVSDERIEPVTLALMPGAMFQRVWGSDVVPTVPADGTEPKAPRYFPPPGGFRFAFFTVGPASATASLPADFDLGGALAELEERLPGLAEHLEPDDPGMHTTQTIDVDLVVSGEVVLELDDGAEVVLRPGDVVVQNGTRHRWVNRGEEPCTLAVAIFGADAR